MDTVEHIVCVAISYHPQNSTLADALYAQHMMEDASYSQAMPSMQMRCGDLLGSLHYLRTGLLAPEDCRCHPLRCGKVRQEGLPYDAVRRALGPRCCCIMYLELVASPFGL